MIKRCRFCGGKIKPDATDCEHCGKQLVKKETPDTDDPAGLNNIESWKKKSIPAWVMYAVLVFFVFVVGLMIAQGMGWIAQG